MKIKHYENRKNLTKYEQKSSYKISNKSMNSKIHKVKEKSIETMYISCKYTEMK